MIDRLFRSQAPRFISATGNWRLGPPNPARFDNTRKYLHMLLGRMQSDRDLKKGSGSTAKGS